MVVLGLVVGIVLGIFAYFKGKKDLDELKRYEFEHRTAGGVVEFSTYDGSKRHNKAKENAAGAMRFGGAVGGICGFLLVIVIISKALHI